MENSPLITHKFGYLRSSQIVNNGLTNPKSMNITLNSPQQKTVFEAESFLWGGI